VLDTATSSCCCTSHRPHLEKICEQAGGSRSLTHADGPLWAVFSTYSARSQLLQRAVFSTYCLRWQGTPGMLMSNTRL
jgi:hypothetical protein